MSKFNQYGEIKNFAQGFRASWKVKWHQKTGLSDFHKEYHVLIKEVVSKIGVDEFIKTGWETYKNNNLRAYIAEVKRRGENFLKTYKILVNYKCMVVDNSSLKCDPVFLVNVFTPDEKLKEELSEETFYFVEVNSKGGPVQVLASFDNYVKASRFFKERFCAEL